MGPDPRQRKNGGWGLTAGKDRVGDQLVMAANDHSFHPIRDALEQLHHDGKHRVERLFVEYLGCPDDDYHRETARLFLLAAVARVYEPGHKFDFVPIIEGAQGARKSTFVKILAMGWGGDPDIDWADGKSIIEQTGNLWIVEMGELASMYKAEFNAFKNAISKQTDTARLAYARFSGAVKRQFVVIGTTNDQEYLSDPTGNRRFWPIDARRAGTIDTDRLEREVPQIWAEAVAIYRAMRANQPHGDLPLYLRGEAAQTALRLQGSRMKESPVDMMAGRIGAWLETPAVPGDGFDGQAVLRKEVCTQMIWQEMERREGTPDRQTASLIGSALARLPGWEKEERRNHRVYGRQQFYRRADD